MGTTPDDNKIIDVSFKAWQILTTEKVRRNRKTLALTLDEILTEWKAKQK